MKVFVNTFGSVLIKKDNHLQIKTPEEKIDIDTSKTETIILTKGTLVSTDALIFALNNNIDIVFSDKKGNVKGRVWNSKFGSIAKIRRKQLLFSFSSEAVEWIKKIIIEKIENQIAILLAFYPDEKELQFRFDQAINKLKDYKTKIASAKGEIITDIAHTLRGWEGIASKTYFETLSYVLPSQYGFKGRSQHPAKDPINAMLNYSYGILYGKIESALIKAGIDPYIGILHREDYNRPVLTFDIIEKFRFWADFATFSIVMQNVIDKESFSVDENGNYWLEGLAKRIIIQGIYDYLNEIVNFPEGNMSREKYIDFYCKKLAKKFLDFKPKNQ